MRITICSSSNNNIENIYKISTKKLLDYLVNIPNIELNWGSCSTSIMGLCYDTFKEANLPIHGFTTKKYIDDLKNLDKANHLIFDTTFDLKKEMFMQADIVLILEGGTGTISEFFSYLEEIRSNDVNKLLILWNENHFYDKLLVLIDDLIDKKFNSESIYNYFKIVDNIDELNKILMENSNV